MVPTDKYTQHSIKFEELKAMGIEVDPGDINDGYVPLDKLSPDNLAKVQDNIKERFNMKQAGDDEGEGGGW